MSVDVAVVEEIPAVRLGLGHVVPSMCSVREGVAQQKKHVSDYRKKG